MNNATIRPVIQKLEEVFSIFNHRLYNGELEHPVITVAPDTTSGAYGWFTTWRAWEDGNGGYYEINICAESLTRPFKDTVGTLLHEMAHLYAQMNDIKDTSRGGTYHNKRFKQIAEAHGLLIGNTEKYGWTDTSLSPETEAFVEEMNFDGFSISRVVLSKTENKKKAVSIKYVCPNCGQSLRSTKELNLICGECTDEENIVRMEVE